MSFLIMQRQATRREAGEAAAAEAVRAGLEERCAAVAARFDLTPREREILVLLAQNYRAPYIAEKLVVSQSTVKTHMRNLYGKLDAHSRKPSCFRAGRGSPEHHDRLASAGEGFQHEVGRGCRWGFRSPRGNGGRRRWAARTAR